MMKNPLRLDSISEKFSKFLPTGRLADPRDRVFPPSAPAVLPLGQDVAPEKIEDHHGVVGERFAHFALGRTPGFREKFGLAKSFGRDQVSWPAAC
jgi:hypothetical protein